MTKQLFNHYNKNTDGMFRRDQSRQKKMGIIEEEIENWEKFKSNIKSTNIWEKKGEKEIIK